MITAVLQWSVFVRFQDRGSFRESAIASKQGKSFNWCRGKTRVGSRLPVSNTRNEDNSHIITYYFNSEGSSWQWLGSSHFISFSDFKVYIYITPKHIICLRRGGGCVYDHISTLHVFAFEWLHLTSPNITLGKIKQYWTGIRGHS